LLPRPDGTEPEPDDDGRNLSFTVAKERVMAYERNVDTDTSLRHEGSR